MNIFTIGLVDGLCVLMIQSKGHGAPQGFLFIKLVSSVNSGLDLIMGKDR